MTDRVILRRGTNTTPPLELAPGELSYSPADNRIWLGDFDGNPVNPLDQTTPLSNALPAAPGTASAGTSDHASRADHVHPHDSAKLDLAGGTMTGALTVLPPTQPMHPATRAYADALALAAGAAPPASSAIPHVDGVGAAGSATPYAREDHVHPTDTSRYAASNPSGYQTAAQVTAALAASPPPPASTLAPVMNGVAAAGSATPYAREDHVHPTDTSRLAAASNLADLANATTARSNLGLGAVAIAGYAVVLPVMDGTAALGVAATLSRSDHVHPTDTSRYAASNPSGYQTAAQVTAAVSAALAGTLAFDGGTF